MCNLYNISTNREAITRLTRALDRAGWNEPSRDVYPQRPMSDDMLTIVEPPQDRSSV